MVTEQNWQPFYLHVHAAADSIQDDEQELRYVPSPSGITSCRLRQWFAGTGVPRSNRIPVDSHKNMAQGTAVEGYWREVYTRAGFYVVSPAPPPLPGTMGVMQSKGGDGLLIVRTDECARVFGMPTGSMSLLELKNFGAWSYFDFIEKGLEKGHPDYWAQVNDYMEGYGVDYCVFHAGMADPSGTKWLWRRIKKHEDPIPPFWMEVVRRDPSIVMDTLNRASEVRYFIDHADGRVPVELRDFNPFQLGDKWPCGYCGWNADCLKAGGPLNVVRGTDEVRG